MGFYGWLQWNIKAEDDKSLLITTWTFKKHFLVVSSILGFSLLFGMFLGTYTQAARELDILVFYRCYFSDALSQSRALSNGFIVLHLFNNYFFWPKNLDKRI